MNKKRIFLGGGSSCEILFFYQLETTRKAFFYEKFSKKIWNFVIDGGTLAFPVTFRRPCLCDITMPLKWFYLIKSSGLRMCSGAWNRFPVLKILLVDSTQSSWVKATSYLNTAFEVRRNWTDCDDIKGEQSRFNETELKQCFSNKSEYFSFPQITNQALTCISVPSLFCN